MPIEYKFNKDLTPFFVGFDELDVKLKSLTNEMNQAEFDPSVFPFYNMYRVDDKTYCLEVNIPGYDENDLDITVEGSLLTVSGTRKYHFKGAKKNLFSGISSPESFTRKWRLSEVLVVKSVKVRDGVLEIMLEDVIPSVTRNKKLHVGYMRSEKSQKANVIEKVEGEVKNVEAKVNEAKEAIKQSTPQTASVESVVNNAENVISKTSEAVENSKVSAESVSKKAEDTVKKAENLEKKPVSEVVSTTNEVATDVKEINEEKKKEVEESEKVLDNAKKDLQTVKKDVSDSVNKVIAAETAPESKEDLDLVKKEVDKAVDDAVNVVEEVKVAKQDEAKKTDEATKKVEDAAKKVTSPKATVEEIQKSAEEVKEGTAQVSDAVSSK